LKSKYDGSCKDCKTTHKVGDEIGKNSNGSWCINGMGCLSAFANFTKPTPPPESKTKDIIEEIKQLVKEFGEMEAPKFESIMKYAISRSMSR